MPWFLPGRLPVVRQLFEFEEASSGSDGTLIRLGVLMPRATWNFLRFFNAWSFSFCSFVAWEMKVNTLLSVAVRLWLLGTTPDSSVFSGTAIKCCRR